jgi:hypothetical protein
MSAAMRRVLLAVLPVAALGAIPATSLASPRSHHRQSKHGQSHHRQSNHGHFHHHQNWFHNRSTSITGTVATPTTYTLSQLQAQPQTTFTVTSGHGSHIRTTTYSGVNVETLVDAAAPVLPATKNAFLSVTLDVSGGGRDVSLALGELDPSFGNHPAYLATAVNGHPLSAPALVIPGDTNPIRTIPDVRKIDVSVDTSAATAPPQPGGLLVTDGSRTRFLSAQQLASLPQQTLNVSFLTGTTPTNATEVGPTLDDVLRAAGVHENLSTSVAAVGDDDYIAAVTPAESWVGGKQLLISLNENGTALAEPRLVVDGDVKGGRYVSGVYDLVVGGNCLTWNRPLWGHRSKPHPVQAAS